MPFMVVCGLVEGWVYRWGGYHQRRRAVLGVNVGYPMVNNGDGHVLFRNYFGRTCLVPYLFKWFECG